MVVREVVGAGVVGVVDDDINVRSGTDIIQNTIDISQKRFNYESQSLLKPPVQNVHAISYIFAPQSHDRT